MEFPDRAKRSLKELGDEDRRRTARARCQARVELQRADRTFMGAGNDLSLGGMLLRGPLVPVGHKVNLSIDLVGQGIVCVEGEVVGHRQPANGGSLAIRFLRSPNRI
jgi:hypothetical protein